ncbi:DNA repair helicase XPB [Tepidibacillus fermentans]|uniref:DNA 3'-5' helicase n=1 Tax=Tepidibacillus fermentans TaxID=1281767 RepID=A0A4R3K653_9BACI|nr:DNA repair helicase XPB [Tepidibacillus fermentans]TCS78240.1 DNA excision repair protein ERCC-3 [Tepidibacillus fermentans]
MKQSMDRPMIIQNDQTLLLEVNHPKFKKARKEISSFAELIKSPEYFHTYRITPITLWNAAANGYSWQQVIGILDQYSKLQFPTFIKDEIRIYMERYGILSFKREGNQIHCKSKDPKVFDKLLSYASLQRYFKERLNEYTVVIAEQDRGFLKQELIKLGYPVQDLAGYQEGEFLSLSLLSRTKTGASFQLRDYQRKAIDIFYEKGAVSGGSGVIVLPCGSGKTVVGIGIMELLQAETLILTTNTSSVRQWIHELIDKTSLTEEMVGEYSGQKKEVKPVTVATYQILTYRSRDELEFEHMKLFQSRNWGLIIYDEVHLLPAPVFRYTANIQAKRRLGLTATLVREDGKEDEVFSLIGPKKYEVPWLQMEDRGWIAKAKCTDIQIPLPKKWEKQYIEASKKQKYRIAATNPLKIKVLKKLIKQHQDDPILIIGQYLNQLEEIAKELGAPLITGQVKQQERDQIYKAFRTGKIKILVVSKVANFAIDLPDAKVAIQVSGTFGSRQEEAQRLGRILRPKEGENHAYFYSLITQQTVDQDYALRRQLFLLEQGYEYDIQHYAL